LKYREITNSSKLIYEGNVVNLRIDDITLPNGNKGEREIVEHSGGVGVVALDANSDLLMVKQFRKPFESEIFEIPAGKLNKGEDHYTCGVRELEEETGYRAGKLTYLGEMYPTPGFCTEIIHIYFATDLYKGEMNLDEDEFLDLHKINIHDAVRMIMNNEIKDAKTITGIMLVYTMLKVNSE